MDKDDKAVYVNKVDTHDVVDKVEAIYSGKDDGQMYLFNLQHP